MEHLEPDQFDNFLSSAEKALVMFYADWCPFCKRFKPIFDQRYQDLSDTASFVKLYGCKLNENENPLWDRFSINAVPTLIAFDGNKKDDDKIISRRDAKMGKGLREEDLNSILEVIKK